MNAVWRRHPAGGPTAPLLAAILLLASTSSLRACPFCTPLAAPLAERREAAAVAGLAELLEIDGQLARLKLRQLAKPSAPFEVDSVLELPAGELAIARDAKPGSLWLLLGTERGDGGDLAAAEPQDLPSASAALGWSAEAVNETVYGYFVRAPGLRVPAAERLQYFARYLEHAEPLIAADVYNEFGLAPLDVVAQVADQLPMDKMRGWLVDADVPGGRKGFYGVALGLARQADDRTANRRLLESLVGQPVDSDETDGESGPMPGSDFRAGFDGMLGGLLLLGGAAGLEQIERQILANPHAAEGDVRHAVTALRFAHEFVPAIKADRLAEALALVLPRPGFAATAVVDLARWQAWSVLDAVIDCYPPQRATAADASAAAVRRAVVGYLTLCPRPAARRALENLRGSDPTGVAAAEAAVQRDLGPAGTPSQQP
ncbi:MAG: hypothetical protein AB7U73_01490 [Pirellulales bacterium]